MLDPISGGIILGMILGAAKTIWDICKLIGEWFAKIGEWRLANIFKKMQALMTAYKSNGFLTAQQRTDWIKYLNAAHKGEYQGKLRSGGQAQLLEKAEEMEEQMSRSGSS